ncbi:MAG: hypothetical protein Q4G22_09625 [Paracoccus sp. (in: a-proteobacteria)]|uniref:hypothetical protein n=1 Tax=Paracoccus sp. TaxID=267 RepID=UPI0026DF20B6|nr:hypothetical protein [Paracoccus sp. (in: a-proteobacteria)]MDO5632086.1 hypothetical protein [Paracoccus sp. (in: a-proteobacteria)]
MPLPERGLRAYGAFIRGDGPSEAETLGLDMEGVTLTIGLSLCYCQIPDKILLRRANIINLNLHGTNLSAGISADMLETKHSIFLRNVTCAGEIRLVGAKVGGDLSCIGATLNSTGVALLGDKLEAKGSVHLGNVTCAGEIRLAGAKLGGDLSCIGATLNSTGVALRGDKLEAKGSVRLGNVTCAGEIRFVGAKLGGELSCKDAKLNAEGVALRADGLETKSNVSLHNINCAGEIRLPGAKIDGHLGCNGAKLTATNTALNAQATQISGAWFWREGASSAGALDFTAAKIEHIWDDPGCWPQAIRLNGCRYGAFVGKAVSGAERINWLARMPPSPEGVDFLPHPYHECARALQDAGHGAEARVVLIEKERLQRLVRRQRQWDQAKAAHGWRRSSLYVQYAGSLISDWLLKWTVAYGRRPLQAAVPLLFLLLIGANTFQVAANAGAIKPNLPQIQRAPEWAACAVPLGQTVLGNAALDGRARPGQSQVACFLTQPEAHSYPKFDALIYSADTLLPIVSLEMQSYWIPDDRKPFGWWARWYLWFHIMAGWALTLLAVAGFSGLIKTDNTK